MIRREVGWQPPPEDPISHFMRWVAESCRSGDRVLDIGAGKARHDYPIPLLARPVHLVGIDPDPTVWENPHLAERHQASLEQFAAGHVDEFDVAYSVFVLEHVADPAAFAAGCARVLKPGGRLLGLTVNVQQYFGLATWAATRLRFDEPLLRRLKGGDVVREYHFPTEYRLNSVRRLTRELERAGFRSVQFCCYEQPRRFQWYLPRRLRWFPPAYARAVYALRAARLMGYLSFRAVR